jgi:histidyl-tRNA synthetase
MHKLPQPVKVWEAGPFFRHEAPQAGRFRQFTQIDAEAIGSDDPSLDAELILLLDEILERAGTGPRRLRMSSLGTPETRAEYIEELKDFYARARMSCPTRSGRASTRNPLRAFDADHPGTQAVMKEAPLLLDRLAADDAEHFTQVRELLDAAGLEYEIDPTLVRGLDYYTRTVFEFESERLGRPGRARGRWALRRPDRGAGRLATPGGRLGGGRGADPHGGGRGRAGRRHRRLRGRDGSRRVRARQAAPRQRPARPDGAGRAVPEGADEAGGPPRARWTVILGDEIEVKDMDSGAQQRAGSVDEVVRMVGA